MANSASKTSPGSNNALSPLARLPLLVIAMISLVVGVLAGLARLGVTVPEAAATQAGSHGALMIAAFLGAVISLERAVALARPWPYLAPLCAGLGGAALLAGAPFGVAQALVIVAAATLCAGSTLILRQQPALYTATLALGALSWLIGSIVWAVAGAVAPAAPWWLAFLVLTIAGERLELTRFLPTPAGARRAFALIVAVMLAGTSLALLREDPGLRLLGAGLIALSLWLMRHDIARHTVRQAGLTRFIAICLLSGYAWLALGGLLGLAGGFVPGSGLRDAALHAVFLGFVFSMIFGHAPIIFPAITGVRIPYHPALYLQFALLHGSLLLRVVGDLVGILAWRQAGAIGNGLALLAFVVTMLISAMNGRRERADKRKLRPAA
ncbi:MAG TPA: hypothetical protein VMV33_07950 [Rhodocyclaceae bacterium]|nr:hypothetical protein [Rhodocyclaceae bacterium]